MIPRLAEVRGYRTRLAGDLLAGVTVAAYLVPQVMAYAGLAGLPPVTGLRAGAVFALARVKRDLLARLEAFGLAARIGPDLLFPTLPTAVQAYQDRTKDLPPGDQRP
jgi:Sulfate permease family